MNKEEINIINKDGWNKLISSNKPFSNTSLPEYGPYMRSEEELHLFDEVKNKKVLEIGCSSGKSLEYLKEKGASELWGIDISEKQIEIAKTKGISNNFFISPMELNPGIPTGYFDYVFSLYSIGFTSDLDETLKHISSYLTKDGIFILSWSHPLFVRLKQVENNIILNKSYNDESSEEFYKGEDKTKTIQTHFKISTLVNKIIESGMVIDKIIEQEPLEKNRDGYYLSNYFDDKRINMSPTTILIVAYKK